MSLLLDLCAKNLCIAHRGARAYFPENTIHCAEVAINQSADMWELDVNYTKDFQLVIVHDDTLTRTTNVEEKFPKRESYRVCDFTLEEIQSLDAGSWFLANDPFKTLNDISSSEKNAIPHAKVPTLKEVLDFTRENNWFVNVEIKDHAHLIGHERVTKDVIDMIVACNMQERVILSSFQHQYLREARDIMPQLPRGVLVEDVRPENPLALCQELEGFAYHPGRSVLEIEDIAPLREAGFYINVWTVNEEDDIEKLIQAGVTGIITDFPDKCTQTSLNKYFLVEK